MKTKHTPGPWVRDSGSGFGCDVRAQNGRKVAATWGINNGDPHRPAYRAECDANARLIAAAPELLEALEEAVDLAWIEDSHQVQFDPTVIFSEFYDFSGVDGTSRIEFHGQHECIVWPGTKWSAYCTYDGSLWFEKFDTAEEAKEACMRLLDRVLPDHPAMRARAVIRKARGAQ